MPYTPADRNDASSLIDHIIAKRQDVLGRKSAAILNVPSLAQTFMSATDI